MYALNNAYILIFLTLFVLWEVLVCMSASAYIFTFLPRHSKCRISFDPKDKCIYQEVRGKQKFCFCCLHHSTVPLVTVSLPLLDFHCASVRKPFFWLLGYIYETGKFSVCQIYSTCTPFPCLQASRVWLKQVCFLHHSQKVRNFSVNNYHFTFLYLEAKHSS